MVNKNGSMVDFGWPSGFFAMSCYYLYNGDSSMARKLILLGPLFFCGLRFMMGWAFGRKHYKREDKRWELWRERWRNGEGWLAIRNVGVNFFIFYHVQSMFNALFVSIPMIIMSYGKTQSIQPHEYAGLALWFFAFFMENKADFQLKGFNIRNRKAEVPEKVCKDGLWYYSRHPNYFFEWMLWISYAIMVFPYANEPIQQVLVFICPTTAYYFLVHFTGVWMAEQSSVKRRGDDYIQYQKSTNMIVPWFPRKLKDN
jgi:steroid 5-alpha reductase family enzyme